MSFYNILLSHISMIKLTSSEFNDLVEIINGEDYFKRERATRTLLDFYSPIAHFVLATFDNINSFDKEEIFSKGILKLIKGKSKSTSYPFGYVRKIVHNFSLNQL